MQPYQRGGCGRSENAAACKALLADLLERGLPANRSLLFVIDGAKALRKAITDTFAARALIQRCRQHKRRNVTDALPERMRATVGSAMTQAYASRDPKRARQLLENLVRSTRARLPGSCRLTARRTRRNAHGDAPGTAGEPGAGVVIDQSDRKLFSRVREMARRVRHWQGGAMILRWTAAGVLEAERHFRKIAGYRSLTKLDAALRAHDAALDRGVDNRRQAA